MSRMVDFLLEWSKNPVSAVQDLFQVTPTKQQEKLLKAAWKPFCRVAVSSCKGAGKTSCLAWMTLVLLMTLEDCRILVTSPSFGQLNRVFQSELRKWHLKMPKQFQEAFIINKDKVVFKTSLGINEATLVTASVENKESLQGGHSDNYIILVDEASGIDAATFSILQSTLSTGNGGRLILTSNPTQASGPFYDIFHNSELTIWDKMYFNMFDCPHTSDMYIQEMKMMYGEDSDEYRISVLGEFPRTSHRQFISAEVVENAMDNNIELMGYANFPRVMGVDVARYGDDETVFAVRQGPKILSLDTFRGKDTQEVGTLVFEYSKKWNVSTIYIDANGVGAGAYDKCKALSLPVKPVIGSNKSSKPLIYFNMRAQIWGELKTWLENGADIPYDKVLREQLVSMTYGYNSKGQIALMTRDHMKKAKIDSPDRAESIAYSLAGNAYNTDVGFKAKARPIVSSTRRKFF